jgi:AcrR family transcriptional regulator
MNMDAVKGVRPPRTRRAEKSERTKRQILDAASALFAANGYAATTIDAIAAEADVAAETIYSRFGNKLTLLRGILEPAIAGNALGVDILDLPEVAAIRAMTDQRGQLAALTQLSRGILERSTKWHCILRNSGADPALAEFVREDEQRRYRVQSAYIDILLTNGPLREGLSHDEAATTYGVLANPDTYDLLTIRRGWTADHYQTWLRTTLTHLLLDPAK